MSARERRRLPVSVLKYRDYRLLWSGQAIVVVGTQMQSVALAWQVYALTGSVVQLGLLGLVRAITLMVASLIGGPMADRSNRRRLLLITQTMMSLQALALAALTYSGVISVWQIFVIGAITSATSAFDGPARQALIPTLIPRDRLTDAMSLNILAMNTARMVGPAIGGVSLALLGAGTTYALHASTFLAVIVALVVMQTRSAAPSTRQSGLQAITEGLRFIAGSQVIWGIMVLDFAATLLGSTVGLAPVFAEDVLRAGPTGLGLLLSAPAAGSVFGGFVLSVVRLPVRPGNLMVLAVIGYGACLAAFGFTTTIPLALLALFGAGLADSLSVAVRHTIRTLATPDELRGRVSAAHSALAMGGPRLGEFQSGMSAALMGPRWAMFAGGVGCMVAAVLMKRFAPAMSSWSVADVPPHADNAEAATTTGPTVAAAAGAGAHRDGSHPAPSRVGTTRS